MQALKKQNVFDRRNPENLYLSMLVDLGMTYKRTLGLQPARIFLHDQQVPVTVVSRILASDTQRRRAHEEINGKGRGPKEVKR